MPRTDPDRVAIGKILRPRGIRGELKIMPFAASSLDRFARLDRVYVELPCGSVHRCQVVQVRQQGRFLNLKIDGIDTIEDAEALRNGFLLIDRSEIPSLPEGSFYVFELVGMEVRTETGRRLGEIYEVLELPANDVYVVRDGTRELLIPAVRDIVRRIDTSSGVMIVDDRKGLTDDEDPVASTPPSSKRTP